MEPVENVNADLVIGSQAVGEWFLLFDDVSKNVLAMISPAANGRLEETGEPVVLPGDMQEHPLARLLANSLKLMKACQYVEAFFNNEHADAHGTANIVRTALQGCPSDAELVVYIQSIIDYRKENQ
jgi:hypothetical protein